MFSPRPRSEREANSPTAAPFLGQRARPKRRSPPQSEKIPVLGLFTKRFGLEPKVFGSEPKRFGSEPKTFGLEPKRFGSEPKRLGLEPKHFAK